MKTNWRIGKIVRTVLRTENIWPWLRPIKWWVTPILWILAIVHKKLQSPSQKTY